MRIDILTLFPDTVNAVLHESILGRAADKGLVEISCVQIRDYTENKQKQVDEAKQAYDDAMEAYNRALADNQ